MIRVGSVGPTHRKPGRPGSFTVLTPEDYKPTHRKPGAAQEEEMR